MSSPPSSFNWRKLAFGCPSLLSAGFTLFISFEYFTGFLPRLYEVSHPSTSIYIIRTTGRFSRLCWLSSTHSWS